MTPAQERVLRTSLIAVGNTVRVAGDNYHVATVQKGMNDPNEYARVFAAAPTMQDVILFIEAQSISHPKIWRRRWPAYTALFDQAVERWKDETQNGSRPSVMDPQVTVLSEAVHHWCNLPLMRKALAHIDYVPSEALSAA
jgi:hypothetical protein